MSSESLLPTWFKILSVFKTVTRFVSLRICKVHWLLWLRALLGLQTPSTHAGPSVPRAQVTEIQEQGLALLSEVCVEPRPRTPGQSGRREGRSLLQDAVQGHKGLEVCGAALEPFFRNGSRFSL